MTRREPRVGDHVQCRCAPSCAVSWGKEHGPCVSGVVLALEDHHDGDGMGVAVRQDHGGATYRVDIGYGQAVRRQWAAEVWIPIKNVVVK